MLAVFPGQGAQFVGMGKELYEAFPIVREAFEESSDAIKRDLKKLCFDGPQSDLTLTENTQPCLLLVSYAAFAVAQKELGFQPKLTAGHSLGEYSALVASGALPLGHAIRWVHERGKAMQTAVPKGEGTMAAIMGLEEGPLRELCAEATRIAKEKRPSPNEEFSVEALVEPANFNAPGQIVIAGSTDGVKEALALIQAGKYPGGKAIPLEVSAPFHCRLMSPARKKMESIFAQAELPKKPLFPYIPNSSARAHQEPSAIFALLSEQIDHPVLWEQSMSSAFQSGHTQMVEFGPGKVLQGLAKRIAKKLDLPVQSAGVSDPNGIKELEKFLTKGTA